MEQNKIHWEEIYSTKKPSELSWTEKVPLTSISSIERLDLPKTAKIIDVGGGDSKLVDYLLEQRFQNITVLDISGEALKRSKNRLGSLAAKVKWVQADINQFVAEETFDLWHDRAAFHFLTDPEEISKYINLTKQLIVPHGHLILGTFSRKGPQKCSGLTVTQYNENEMSFLFSNGFRKINCIELDHVTPSNKKQNFMFCSSEDLNLVMKTSVKKSKTLTPLPDSGADLQVKDIQSIIEKKGFKVERS